MVVNFIIPPYPISEQSGPVIYIQLWRETQIVSLRKESTNRIEMENGKDYNGDVPEDANERKENNEVLSFQFALFLL